MRSLAVLLGVLAAVFLLGPPAGIVMLLVALLCVLIACVRPGPALVLMCAFLFARSDVQNVLAHRIDCEERVIVTADIASVPARTDSGWVFDADLSHPREPDRPDVRARIEYPGSGATRPRAGERWQLLLNYAGQQGPAAAGVRDPRWILLRDRIHVRARVIPSSLNQRLAAASTSLLTLREHVAERIVQRAVDPAAGALLAALAVGVTGEVSARQWRVFNATGITHLIAISGMHVTFFALISMWLARRVWGWTPLLQRIVRRESFSAMTGVLLAAGYALLSGFSVPAQRTLVMLAAFLALREASRDSRPCASVGVATVAILAWDPLAVLGAGFWLSFAAVAAIVLLPGQRVRAAGALSAAVDVQRCVSVALLPLTLGIFGLFSGIGLIVNAFAIPVFTFALVPCVLLATLGYLLPGAFLGAIADRLVDLAAWIAGPLWTMLGQAADLPGAVWPATPGADAFLVATGAAVLTLLPLSPLVRWSALAAIALVFLQPVATPPRGVAWVEVLDVGAETSVLVRTQNHALLAGTAETFGGRGRRFESRVVPLLRTRVAAPLDLALAGQLNRDRLGAVSVAQALLPSRKWLGTVRQGELPPEMGGCERATWRWDEVDLQLAPPATGKGCVLRLSAGGQQAVLLLEVDAEALASLQVMSSPRPSLLLLPRRPLALSPAEPGTANAMMAVASISQRERESPGWMRQAQQMEDSGIRFLSTAEQGHVAVELAPDRTTLRQAGPFQSLRKWFAFPGGRMCPSG